MFLHPFSLSELRPVYTIPQKLTATDCQLSGFRIRKQLIQRLTMPAIHTAWRIIHISSNGSALALLQLPCYHCPTLTRYDIFPLNIRSTTCPWILIAWRTEYPTSPPISSHVMHLRYLNSMILRSSKLIFSLSNALLASSCIPLSRSSSLLISISRSIAESASSFPLFTGDVCTLSFGWIAGIVSAFCVKYSSNSLCLFSCAFIRRISFKSSFVTSPSSLSNSGVGSFSGSRLKCIRQSLPGACDPFEQSSSNLKIFGMCRGSLG